MTKDEGERVGVENNRLYFRAFEDKANLAPPAENSTWFKLESVTLPNGHLGSGDHVGVVVPWKWPDAFDGVTAADLLKVQQRIDGKNYRQNVQAKDWVGHAVADVLGFDADAKSDRERIKSMLRTWTESGALSASEIKDAKGNMRPVVEVGEWAT